MVDQAQRAKNALKILDLSDLIDTTYARLKHYNDHGVLPGVKVEKQQPSKAADLSKLDKAGLIIAQQNYRTYVTKYRKRMEANSSPELYDKNKTMYENYKSILEEIERRINAC